MSMIGELNYFLDLQVKQMKDGIFINQAKHTRDIMEKFGVESKSLVNIPMNTMNLFQSRPIMKKC